MIETFGLAIVALLPFLAAPIVAYLAKYNRLAAAWSSAAATIMAFLVLLFYIKLPCWYYNYSILVLDRVNWFGFCF